MSAISILMCGQVRSAEQCLATASKYATARAEGLVRHIVFSTWHGEIDRYEGLRTGLRRYGVETLEAPIPSAFMDAPGNFYFQALQAKNGLEKFGPSEIILKTRPDIRINAALNIAPFIEFIDAQLKKTPDLPIGFDRPIGVSLMNSLIPFWIEDRFIYGRCSDIRQMTTMTRAGDIIGHPHTFIAEARWFAHFFVEHFPVIRHIMRINWMLRAYVHNHELSKVFFSEDIIYRCLAVFDYIMATHFIVGLPPACVDKTVFADTTEPEPHSFGISQNIPELFENRFFRATRASIERDGIQMLCQPEIVDFFRLKINQLAQRVEFQSLVQPSYD